MASTLNAVPDCLLRPAPLLNLPSCCAAPTHPERKGAFQAGERANFNGKIKYRHCKKPVYTPADWDPRLADRSAELPNARLMLDFVYGYQGVTTEVFAHGQGSTSTAAVLLVSAPVPLQLSLNSGCAKVKAGAEAPKHLCGCLMTLSCQHTVGHTRVHLCKRGVGGAAKGCVTASHCCHRLTVVPCFAPSCNTAQGRTIAHRTCSTLLSRRSCTSPRVWEWCTAGPRHTASTFSSTTPTTSPQLRCALLRWTLRGASTQRR